MKSVNRIISFVVAMCVLLIIFTVNAAFPASSFTQEDYPVSKTEDFEYPALAGKSVADGEIWEVEGGLTSASAAASTAYIEQNPEDSTDYVLDLHNVGGGASANLVASADLNVATDRYFTVEAKLYFSGSSTPSWGAKDNYFLYVQGDYSKNGTVAYPDVAVSQIRIQPSSGITNVLDGVAVSSGALDLEKWTDIKMVYDTVAMTYDLYINNTKANSEPIAAYGKSRYGGATITSVRTLKIGILKEAWRGTHMYADDIIVRSLTAQQAATLDGECINIPSVVDSDFDLPLTGEVFGSAINWSSDNGAITVNEGRAVVAYPQSTAEVVLSADIVNNDSVVRKTFTITVAGDSERVAKMQKALTSYTFSGQKYVKNSFSANIPYRYDSDRIEITTSDTSVECNGDTITVVPGAEDKIVPVDVSVISQLGNSFTKTLKLYIPSASVDFLYDGMDYPENIGQSVANAQGWTLSEENNSTTIFNFAKSPDDESDMVIDAQVVTSGSASRMAVRSIDADIYGKTILQTNIMFGGTAANAYPFYVNGEYTNTSYNTVTAQPLVQLQFVRKDNTIVDVKTGTVVCSEVLPEKVWFNLKLVLDPLEKTYDLYIDNEKINPSPMSFYRNMDAEKVTAITSVEAGVNKSSWRADHFCMDDLYVRASMSNILDDEYTNLVLPKTAIYDITLPREGVYEGTCVSWETSDASRIDMNGKVTRSIGFGHKNVTLTATISYGEKTVTKKFDIKVVNTPPYTINNITFTDDKGETTYLPVSGGILKKASITKYTDAADDNATAIAAVYDMQNNLVVVSAPVVADASGDVDFDIQLPAQEQMYAVVYVWDINSLAPLAYSFTTANAPDTQLTLYTIGDSTMQSYGELADRQLHGDMTGWGQVIGLGLDSDYVNVKNYAVAGKSSKSFYGEGYINDVFDGLEAGDYLLIQFGHNDQKTAEPNNYTTLGENGTYRQYLNRYVEGARLKGAYPVFATSIYRRQFEDDNKTPIDSHNGYPQDMITFASVVDVPVLDMHTATGKWLKNLGYEDSEQYFIIHQRHESKDNTHLLYKGAVQVCNLAVDLMKETGLPISVYASKIAEN